MLSGGAISSEEASCVMARTLDAHVLERGRGGDPPARGALDEPLLEQVGLVDVLDRVGLLADRDRQRGQADRAALELLADRPQDVAVEPVQAGVVDLQQVERLRRAPRGRSRPAARTSAKSRTRLSSRLATRGVPRLRAAIARAPSSSISTPRIPAERRTIAPRSVRRVGLQAVRGCRSGRAAAWSAGPPAWWRRSSVNGGRSSVTTRAPAPWPTVIGSWRSSIAG